MEKIKRLKPKVSPFTSLKFKNYRLFILGFFISQLGLQMTTVAVAWQIYELTNSAVSLGLVGLARFLPVLFFGIIGGISADKFNKKLLLILTQVLLAINVLILGLATFYNIVSPAIIYTVLALNGAVMAFYAPVRQSIIPSLVPKDYLMNAISLNTLARQSSIVIGPGIAGYLIAFFGVQSVYFLNVATFFVLLITLVLLKVPPMVGKKAEFSIHSIMEGIRFVKSSPILYSTMLLDFFASFFASATTLLPIFAKDILQVGPQGLGILYAAPSIGGVLAGLVLSTIKEIKHQGKIIVGAVIIFGLSMIAFGLSRSFYLSLLFLAIYGASDMVSAILRNTIRQMITPEHIRGRMVSINMLFVQGGPLLGEVEAGLLAGAVGTPLSVVLGGIGAVFATLTITKAIPRLRNYTEPVVAPKV